MGVVEKKGGSDMQNMFPYYALFVLHMKVNEVRGDILTPVVEVGQSSLNMTQLSRSLA